MGGGALRWCGVMVMYVWCVDFLSNFFDLKSGGLVFWKPTQSRSLIFLRFPEIS